MLETVYSVSDDLDPLAGVCRVVADCSEKLAGRQPAAGLFFTSCMGADYGRMLAEIHTAFPGIELIGCTTDGEITPQRGFTEDSSALLLLVSEDFSFTTAVAEQISTAPEATVRDVYEQALKRLGAEPAAIFLLPDGLTTMNVSLDRVFQSAIGDSLPIFGGLAGDGFELKKTYQFMGRSVFTDAMPLLLIDGDLEIAVGIARGPAPYGDFYSVDKVEGNKVHFIDGVTALEFYERYFGEYLEQHELSLFPLAAYGDDDEKFVLRDPINVNRLDGSITFLGRFESPCRVRLTQVTREDTLRSADQGARHVLTSFKETKPDLVLLFSCTSRRHVLGSRTDEEFSELARNGQNVPYFGFYCYGEIGPFTPGDSVYFHSNTSIYVALRSLTR